MSTHALAARKEPRRPEGYEGHLTRRQAAAILGFASEFKVRQYERQGLLRSIRGPMRTAFYARADVLALKARLSERQGDPADERQWSDADLIALLERPGVGGEPRTALDLVMEARITIERAERVHAFWAKSGGRPVARLETQPSAPGPVATASDERRSDDRLERDRLIRNMRDPDPRIRQRAFDALRSSRAASP